MKAFFKKHWAKIVLVMSILMNLYFIFIKHTDVASSTLSKTKKTIADIQFNFSIFQLLRYSSYLFNAYFLLMFILDRIILDRYLSGFWSGVLIPQNHSSTSLKDMELDCKLSLVHQNENKLLGMLKYKRVDISDDRNIIAQGVDELREYKDNPKFIFNGSWKPLFSRVMHKQVNRRSVEQTVLSIENETVETEAIIVSSLDTHPSRYEFECKAINILFTKKMKVTLSFKMNETANEEIWEGVFFKSKK